MEYESFLALLTQAIQWAVRKYAEYPWFHLLIMMMGVDVLTGLLASNILGRGWNSSVSFRGMVRKSCIILVIGAAGLVDAATEAMLPDYARGLFRLPIAKLTAGSFFITETISVLENAKICGVPIPGFIIDGISKMQRILDDLSSEKSQKKKDLNDSCNPVQQTQSPKE